MMRSGRMRSELRTRSRIVTSPLPSTLAGRASSVTTCGCCRRSSALSSTVMMRSPAGTAADIAFSSVVLPAPVPPEITTLRRAATQARSSPLGRLVERAHLHQLREREQAREAPDRHRRPAQRERRDDHVDALAGRQARVDHRAGLVDAAVDLRDDAVDRLVQLRLVGEGDVRALEPALALEEDLVGAVDHDLGDRRVGEQRLEHPEADRLVDHAPDQPRALRGREHRPLARHHPPDHALEPRAALRRATARRSRRG